MEKKTQSFLRSLLGAIAVLAVLILISSQWFTMGKNEVFDHNGIRIYASQQISTADVTKVADRALSLLQQQDIQLDGTTNIVLYDTREEFKWRNFFISSGALAMNWWPLPYITFSPVDMANDHLYARNEILSERPVSSVIAHELVHTYQAHQLNVLGYKLKTFLQPWKTEGMAEVVSHSSSVSLDKGLEFFLRNVPQQEIDSIGISGEYFYFKSHLKTDYLLKYKQVSEEDFWSNSYDVAELENEIREAINNGEYLPQSF